MADVSYLKINERSDVQRITRVIKIENEKLSRKSYETNL